MSVQLFIVFVVVMFLFLILEFVNSLSFSGGDLFLQCDSNKDSFIDKFELNKCITPDNEKDDSNDINKYNQNSLKSIIIKMDTNHDSKISLNEYLEGSKLNKNNNEDDSFEVLNSDGSIKKMNKNILFDSIEKNMKGMKMSKDGKMMKDVEGTESINNIMKNNPQMGSFIKLGNYSVDYLKSVGIVKEGSLYQMKSKSDNNNNKIDNQQIIKFNGNFSVLIIYNNSNINNIDIIIKNK
jgi:hypothetical protein